MLFLGFPWIFLGIPKHISGNPRLCGFFVVISDGSEQFRKVRKGAGIPALLRLQSDHGRPSYDLTNTLRCLIIVPWVANNESLGGPGGPGTGFCNPGGGFFSLSRRSGLPLPLLPLKHTKTSTMTTRTTQGLLISPPGTIIKRLRVYVLRISDVFLRFSLTPTSE